MLTTLSMPHRLHLIGKSLTSVVGSNHKTVCFPHAGHKNLLWFSFSVCKLFCNSLSPHSGLPPFVIKQKTCTTDHIKAILGAGAKAQAQRMYIFNCNIHCRSKQLHTVCLLQVQADGFVFAKIALLRESSLPTQGLWSYIRAWWDSFLIIHRYPRKINTKIVKMPDNLKLFLVHLSQ